MRNIISAAVVAKLKKPGRYAVGNGAYLQISKWGTKSWVYRYQRAGRSRHMGLGPAWLLSLAEARQKARDAARLLLEGIDPLEAKRRSKHAARLASVRSKTFRECAEAYISAHEAGWRTKWSRNQWISSLEKYVYPKIGDLPVADIDVACVLSAVEPIWTKSPETGSRIRGRIKAVLDWAGRESCAPVRIPLHGRGGSIISFPHLASCAASAPRRNEVLRNRCVHE